MSHDKSTRGNANQFFVAGELCRCLNWTRMPNRTPELQLVNPDLKEDIYNLIEAAELDPEQEAKLERELSRQYHIRSCVF